MNMLTPNTVTLTTVEIAELTGKRHDNVLRDADRALELINESRTSDLRSQIAHAAESTFESRGKQYRMLILDKHLTFTLITGYDTGLRYNVMGRWIELEQAANPAFAAQAITETLKDLQSRVDAMAPAYDEHVRKGRSVGYSWREACRLAGIDYPDKLLALLVSRGRARKRSVGPEKVSLEDNAKVFTELHSDYLSKGYIITLKPSNLVVSKNGGHLFKITLKGLNEWLKPKAETMNAAVTEAAKPNAVKDEQGFVVEITGENTLGMRTTDL
ncbi:Rha family transcriptional regulator [Pseudomonas syringae]|uniref:Rha family transcriptional regulator n=1 Tax=Pseudomonas syringae TaxID=317 RepID=UPI000F004965|nr:Rha family transcriptional regulator [Pseudomonas syringae]